MAVSRSARVTVLKPDRKTPLDIHGELCLDAPTGRQLKLSASGSRLSLDVPGWIELRGLGPRSLLAQRRRLAAMTRLLQRLRLTVDVDIDGDRAFGLGAGVKTSLLARLLGLTSTDLSFSTAIRLLRSRASAPRADRR
jgi:hypothetical protein